MKIMDFLKLPTLWHLVSDKYFKYEFTFKVGPIHPYLTHVVDAHS